MKTVLSVLLVSTAGLMAVGCGKSGTGSSVTGSVTYKGNPVTGGTLLFHASDKVFPASLGPDGNYTCQGVPPGDYTVTIDTKHLKNIVDPEAMMKMMNKGSGASGDKRPEGLNKDLAMMKEKGMSNMPKYVSIPDKYASAKTSGITVKVESGSNSRDLKLTD